MTVFQEVLRARLSGNTKAWEIAQSLLICFPPPPWSQEVEGYTHDDGEAVLGGRRHLLAGCANVLDGCVKVVQIRRDGPLIY